MTLIKDGESAYVTFAEAFDQGSQFVTGVLVKRGEADVAVLPSRPIPFKKKII